jgi:hypothetical protein
MGTMQIGYIQDAPIPRVSAANQTLVYQQIECTVNRSKIDGLAAGMNGGINCLGGHVSFAVSDSLYDHLALRSYPAAALAEFIEQSMTMGHCEHPLLQLFATRLYQILSIFIPRRTKKGRSSTCPFKTTRKSFNADGVTVLK